MFVRTNQSANTEPSTSENDTATNSVKQNAPAVQEEPNSVTQNNCNSLDSEPDWSRKIEKGKSYLKRNPNPEYNPSKLIKFKPSEAEFKARTERAEIFKDKTTYNVLPSLFDKVLNH